MTDPFTHGPRAPRPAHLPPVWPPIDPETGLVDLSDDADPPDGFFTDPDVARRMAAAATVAQGLSPAESMRESNRKLSELTRAQWDLDVRRRAYEKAKAFSFTDPADGREPVFVELSPEDAAKLDEFAADTALQVDFPREYGGYFAAIRDPAEDREIGVVPAPMVLALADEVRTQATADPAADPEDDEGWLSRFLSSERLSGTILRMTPFIGSALSAHDALESWGKAIEAVEREDWDAFVEHGGMGLLNTVGAVGGPLGGFLVRLVKIGVGKLVRATPGAREAVAAHRLSRAKKRADKPFSGTSVQKTLGSMFHRLSNDQKRTLRALFPGVLGRSGESHAVRLLGDIRQTVTTDAAKTTTKVNIGGRTVKRRYDALVEKVQHNVFVDAFKIFRPNTRTAAVEVKVGGSRLGRQKKIDQAMEADGSFAQEAAHFRFSVKQIPEKDFEDAVRQLFAPHVSSGKFSAKEVDRIVGRFKRLRRGHGDWVTAEVVIGVSARAIASRFAEDEEKRRWKEDARWRRDAEYHGAANAQMMTGA